MDILALKSKPGVCTRAENRLLAPVNSVVALTKLYPVSMREYISLYLSCGVVQAIGCYKRTF